MRIHDAETLYLKRKIGIGNSWRYKASSFAPLVIIMLITAVLSFSIIFISSMSDAIEKAIIYLGSGAVYSAEYADPAAYGGISDEWPVRSGEGIIYAENGEGLVYLKGVDAGYFTKERSSVLHVRDGYEHSERGILISGTLASSLGLSSGDKLTLLYYEEDKSRTRPVLLTVSGVFDSGYAQLDRYLAFVDSSLLPGSAVGYEICLDKGVDPSSFAASLRAEGIDASSFDQLYSSLYGNVRNSISILYLIFASVAFLAAFFSTDAAHAYADRDRKDIAAMMLLGVPVNVLRRIYLRMTLFFIFLSSLSGILIGVMLSFRIPVMMRIIADKDASVLQYYITSFPITVPYVALCVIMLVMVAVSAVSVCISLRSIESKEINGLVKGE